MSTRMIPVNPNLIIRKPMLQNSKAVPSEYMTQRDEPVIQKAKICYYSCPDSHEHFQPIVDTFLSTVVADMPIRLIKYDRSDSAKQHPVICFGFYMSCMDSDINEALQRVEGLYIIIVYALFYVLNIQTLLYIIIANL